MTIITKHGELIYSPLEWQSKGLQQTRSGYGRTLTTRWKIYFNGREYRLYCTQYSNAGSVWFKTNGETIYVH